MVEFNYIKLFCSVCPLASIQQYRSVHSGSFSVNLNFFCFSRLKNGHTLVTNQPNALLMKILPSLIFSFWIEKNESRYRRKYGMLEKVPVKQWTI